jgi:hypothetical protein
MDAFGIDITHIIELGTQVAQAGTIRTAEMAADSIFDHIVGVAVVVYESGFTAGGMGR